MPTLTNATICGKPCGTDCTMGGYECQIPMPIGGRVRGIDRCIAPIVAALNAANIETVASCGGHGDLSRRSIILEDGQQLHFSQFDEPKTNGENP